MSEIGPLNMAVCIKICPDTAQLRVDPATRAPDLEFAPFRVGTIDENAVEEAVRLKETYGGRIVAVTLAPKEPPQELIHKVLAMGADEAVVVEDPTASSADALATATVLRAALSRLGPFDLVLCGEGSLDAYNRQVGPRLATALGVQLLAQVTKVGESDGKLLAHRAFEDRTEVVEITFPAVLTVGQEINEPRFPTVLQIMSASGKTTTRWRLSDLGFGPEQTTAAFSSVRTVEIFAPPEDRRRIEVPGKTETEVAGELARLLFEQGLVKVE